MASIYDAVIVCGDRHGGDNPKWKFVVPSTLSRKLALGATLIHGGAKGIDTIAEEETAEMEREVRVFPADWDKHGKAAGPIRNREMLNFLQRLRDDTAAEIAVFAFHDDIANSRGTRDMGTITRKAKIPLFVCTSDGQCKEY